MYVFAGWVRLRHKSPSNTAGTQPKAFLNVLFFDERFNFVAEGSTQIRVATAGDNAAPLAITNLKVPKNGFAYIYVSNESSTNVFFDNLTVRHDRGRIIEENHYYAFGLKIPALSSKSFEALPNAYQYQGDYAEFDDDLGWNDFALRSYDPQIGRFLQHDPYDQFASGYVGMGNDPGNIVDEDGGWGSPVAGCKAAAGMIGYGGMASNLGCTLQFGATLSTVATIGSIASKGLSVYNNVAQQGFSNQLQNAANSIFDSESENNGVAPSEPQSQDSQNDDCADCNAPSLTTLVTRGQNKQLPDPLSPNINPKPKPVIRDNIPDDKKKAVYFNETIKASYKHELAIYERSLSEEQIVFTDELIKTIKNRCNGVLKISRIDVSVPINVIPTHSLNATLWGGGTIVNRFGIRIDNPVGYSGRTGIREPNDGNGFSGRSNLREQGMKMGRRMSAALGGGKVFANPSVTPDAKFVIKVIGICIN